MIRSNDLRAGVSGSWIVALLLCGFAVAANGGAVFAQTPTADSGSTPQAAAAQPAAEVSAGAVGRPAEPTPSKHQLREAEDAYLSGAKKLEHDQLDAAETEFKRALKLDPENRNYAVAISVARQHRVTELVQQATRAREAGNQGKAEALLAEARAIDPENPYVLEHSGPFVLDPQGPGKAGVAATPIADRGHMLQPQTDEPWKIQGPSLAGAIQLEPDEAVKSHTLSGSSGDVIRNVALAYGIRAVIDDSVEQKQLRFNLDNVDYQRAMSVVMSMAHVFAVPVDEKTIIVAKDDSANRQRLERQLQETIYMPGLTTDQINELAQVVKSVFDVKQASVEVQLGSIVVRAPRDILDPLNITLKGLMDGPGEVLIEVKLYEVDTTNNINAGTTLPTQFSVFNVGAAATQLVNANQTLVQQGIAQGLILPTDSTLVIAGKLIASGLVQSSLLTNLLGVFGGGLTMTGVSANTTTTINFALNTTDYRELDDVQQRVGDHQAGVFREGEKYPITTSTYSTGLSAAVSPLSNASINGVPLSTLLAQYSGGTSTTIPQVTYENLGVTLKATPVIEKSGRINLNLDLKIEALAGGTLDGNPILESRQFATDLTVGDGESALMVSNVTKSEALAMAGIPGLSELPGFQLPTQQTVQKQNSQLVVVVTPHVVRRRSDVIAGPRIPTRPIADN
jgi:Flp pilus assembly secretin CpaC/tetratricopeptide (TPR) repeat protein